MTLTRKLVIATGSLVSIASMAQAQFAFPSFNQSGNGTIGTTWQETNLGAAPAGTYTSYLVVMDWTGPSPTINQWSSEVDIAFGANSTGALGTSTAGPATTAVSPRYVVNANSATGSTGTVNPVNNMFWTGNFTTPYTGGSNLSFYSHQSFGATAPATANSSHNNIRVVLNPTISYSSPTNTATGIAAPTSNVIDIGQIDGGGSFSYHSPAITTAAGSALQWFRFSMASNGQVPGFLLDLDSNDNANSQSSADSEIHLFYQQGDGTLVLINTDDDDGTGNRSLLTFGSNNTTANGRGYGNAAESVYDGRDGNGALFTAGNYFIALGQFNGGATALPTATGSLNGAGTGLNVQYAWSNTTLTLPTSFITTQLNLNYAPTPGAVALMGLGGLVAARRRRA